MEKKEEVPVLNHGQMKALSAKMKENKDERFLEQSRLRLDKIISTKVRTAFIGALAAFEEEFGFLWGQDLEEDQLTDEHDDMLELWNKTRTTILNNGNTQLRAVRNEIANQTVKWNRYHTNFTMGSQEDKS